jgi:hypothetical protein
MPVPALPWVRARAGRCLSRLLPGEGSLPRIGPPTPTGLNLPLLLQPMGARLHRPIGKAQALGDLPDFQALQP